jgi:hypothetical protein
MVYCLVICFAVELCCQWKKVVFYMFVLVSFDVFKPWLEV